MPRALLAPLILALLLGGPKAYGIDEKPAQPVSDVAYDEHEWDDEEAQDTPEKKPEAKSQEKPEVTLSDALFKKEGEIPDQVREEVFKKHRLRELVEKADSGSPQDRENLDKALREAGVDPAAFMRDPTGSDRYMSGPKGEMIEVSRVGASDGPAGALKQLMDRPKPLNTIEQADAASENAAPDRKPAPVNESIDARVERLKGTSRGQITSIHLNKNGRVPPAPGTDPASSPKAATIQKEMKDLEKYITSKRLNDLEKKQIRAVWRQMLDKYTDPSGEVDMSMALRKAHDMTKNLRVDYQWGNKAAVYTIDGKKTVIGRDVDHFFCEANGTYHIGPGPAMTLTTLWEIPSVTIQNGKRLYDNAVNGQDRDLYNLVDVIAVDGAAARWAYNRQGATVLVNPFKVGALFFP